MTRLGVLPRLVAFAYKNRSLHEYLDRHLYEVSIHMYPFLANKRRSIKFVGILAGALHDIGKAVDVYQNCSLYDLETQACSYVGHEVFSALLTVKIVDLDSVPDNVVKDLADFLSCNEIEARRALIRIALVSIIGHHQAMGDPSFRFERFVHRVTKQYGLRRLGIDRAVVEVVEKVLESARRALREDYLYVELDPRGVDHVEELYNSALRKGRQQLIDSILSELRMSFFSKGYNEKLFMLEKFIMGCLIAADIYVAGLRRGEALSNPLHRYLDKVYRFYSRYLPASALLNECSIGSN
ncbi:MAG: CRISPR-associated endonuclease Cas3'' [Thermoprotei archaeon]|nr:MAG: CRISPR-associated endonuclease Cas3'' [Thermoprotei archaeon]